MDYEPKIVTSPRGLSQEQALVELQDHPQYKAGTKIGRIQQRGDRWAIRILEPKVAEFPPKEDDEESSDDEESPFPPKGEGDDAPEGPPSGDGSADSEGPPGDSESDGDSPFPPKGDKGEKPGKPDEGVVLTELIGLVHQIADKLGIGGPDDGLGLGPDGPHAEPGPPLGGPPGHHAPPGGPPGGAPHPGRPLRPGEAPPGSTPVGAPAFASVAEMASQVPSFTASTEGATPEMTVKEASEQLKKQFSPHYKIGQLKRDQASGEYVALLSVR